MRSFQILFVALITFSGCYIPLNLNQVLINEDPYKEIRTVSLRQQNQAFADRSLRGKKLGYRRNVMLHFHTKKTGEVTATEIQMTIGTNVLERVQDEVFFDINGDIFRKEIKELREELYQRNEDNSSTASNTRVENGENANGEAVQRIFTSTTTDNNSFSYTTKESLYKVEIDNELRHAILKGKKDLSMRFYIEDVPYNVFFGVTDLKRVKEFLTTK